MTDDRERRDLSPEEEAELIAARKKAEAEADQADERARIATLGGAAFGMLGLVVAAVALLVQENVQIGVTGAIMGFVGFGVVSAAQAKGLFGRGGD